MQTFQLTPSRRATLRDVDKLEVQEFQLTPSRRATHSDLHSLDFLIYFNSRPHGGRRTRLSDCRFQLHISTHALTEGDVFVAFFRQLRDIFQLTPSRRATARPCRITERRSISTHALTEGDSKLFELVCAYFISTHALTEGDFKIFVSLFCRYISTHALTEGDLPPY